MKIIINNESIQVTDYDDDSTILEKYAIVKPNALPSYLRFVNHDFSLKSNIKLEITDVRDTIQTLTNQQLSDPKIIDPLLASYPNLKKREIGFLWILQNYPDITISGTGPHRGSKKPPSIDITHLKVLDRLTFTTVPQSISNTLNYIKEVEKERQILTLKIQRENEAFEKISKVEGISSVGPFQLEEIMIQIILTIPNGDNLLDIFDAIDVSRDIPFILLAYKNKRYFKIYKQIIPLDTWIEYLPPQEGIYFKILNAPYGKLNIKTQLLDNLYSDGMWTKGNRIDINYKVKSTSEGEDIIKNKLLNSLGDRLTYNLIYFQQVGIKGTFQINDFDWNRAVFADMVDNDPIISSFLFMNEHKKTILQKPRFYMYYQPQQTGNIEQALSITITPRKDTLNILDIRISKSSNIQQANTTRLVLSKLFGIYKQNYKKVVAFYTKFIPNFESLVSIPKKKKGEKKNKKTGLRLQLLEQFDKDLFPTRYGDQCQKGNQPYVIQADPNSNNTNEQEAAKIAKKLGGPHKVMLFDGHWYACEPRDPDDKDQLHIWPGLKVNTEKDQPEWKKKYPLIPCCYKTDQYEKKASSLRKYMEEQRPTKEEKSEQSTAGYVYASNKLLPPGRFGEMPFYWEKLLVMKDIKKIKKGKQEIYPIVRYGVIVSPDSFLHCMERAMNPKYLKMSLTEKQDRIMEIRHELLGLNSGIAKQELYDYSDVTIAEFLKDKNQYVDPSLYISLVQIYYGCNIFLYVVDSLNPDGNIVIPHHSQAYLLRDIDVKKKSVLIIKYEIDGEDFPYQCELVCSLEGGVSGNKIKKVTPVFENSPIVNLAVKLLYDSNEVFIVNPHGYDPYVPVSETI